METALKKRLSGFIKNNPLIVFGISFCTGIFFASLSLFIHHGAIWILYCLTTIFLFNLFCLLFWKKGLMFFYTIFRFLGKGISFLLSNMILGILFYVIFTPIAILLRIFKKDIIKKDINSPQWTDIPPHQNDPKRLEKFF